MAAKAGSRRAGSEVRGKALVRLRGIEGQLRGLQRMLDEDRDCEEVLTQIAAVHEALRSTGKLLARSHMRDCLRDALRSGDRERAEEAAAEVLNVVYRHGR